MSLFRIALEEIANGKAFKEIEYEFYGRLTNIDDLKAKASSMVSQEQWEINVPKKDNNAGSGRIRIRKNTENGKVEYIQTTKSLLVKDNARIEVGIPTTEDNFKQFTILADTGMIKDRYCVKVGEFVFEYDLFKKPDGSYYEWVKVDLEVSSKEIAIPELPIQLEDLITNQKYSRTEEEIKIIDNLYKTMFLSKNKYL